MRLKEVPAAKQAGGKGETEKDKQPAALEKMTRTNRQDTQTQSALLAELQALHHTHREATRLFLMAASQGATDAQIVDALRQKLPHLTDPASLQDQSFGKQPRGLAYKQSKARKIMIRRRGRAPRVKLRRRDHCCHCCSPLTPLQQLWKPSRLRTGAGLGRLAGRSC